MAAKGSKTLHSRSYPRDKTAASKSQVRSGTNGGFGASEATPSIARQHHHQPSDAVKSDLEVDELSQDASSDDEEFDQKTEQPYTSLLQILSASSHLREPQRKRRKLDSTGGLHPPAWQSEILPDTSPDGTTNESAVIPATAGSDLVEVDNSEEEGDELLADEGSADEGSADDPFEKHLASELLEDLNKALETESGLGWSKKIVKPSPDLKCLSCLPNLSPHPAHIISDLKDGLSSLRIKSKLMQVLDDGSKSMIAAHSLLARQVLSYKDVYFTDRTVSNGPSVRQIYSLHALNHVLKTRDRVIRNNAKQSKANDDDESEFRDQGFTRPKVLFILPTRQACVRVMDCITKLLQPEQQENRKRFQDAFSRTDDLAGSDKPDDFKELFSGNDDDRFMLGVKITRKTIKYYASFYSADMIFASPLALHGKVATADKKRRDSDFLSSIEVAIFDQADALLMQNWENVETIVKHLNLEPKEAHGCDFARVRRWYLDRRAKYWRQTLVFSGFGAPELQAMFERSMLNLAGKLRLSHVEYGGILAQLEVRANQTFYRFDASSPLEEPTARFKYFTTSIVPLLSKLALGKYDKLKGTLIFVPSYMDFLRVQNFFCYSNESQSITFDPGDMPCISEYASKSQNARAKTLFQTGKHPVLLYTGRTHHFYRYKLSGVRRVIMYGLPDNPVFYREIAGEYLGRSVSEGRFAPQDVGVQIMFSRYDAMKLERIVGTKRATAMVKEKGDIFEFV